MPIRPNLNLFLDRARETGFVRRVLELARDEDLGAFGDLTSLATIPADRLGAYRIECRQRATLAGLALTPDVLALFAPRVTAEYHAADGDELAPKTAVATLRGPVREILIAERTLLNLIGRLSGVATRTAAFIAAMGPRPSGKPQLCDTRKTTPGLRLLEKYAVLCGGGSSHRLGLHDAVLIKDNHIAGVSPEKLPGEISAAIGAIRALPHGTISFVQAEVDSLKQFAALLNATPEGLTMVLLDNMAPEQLTEAVRMRDAAASTLVLEASGGVNLETIRAIAESGVERVSVGSLTHGAISIDFGLDAC